MCGPLLLPNIRIRHVEQLRLSAFRLQNSVQHLIESHQPSVSILFYQKDRKNPQQQALLPVSLNIQKLPGKPIILQMAECRNSSSGFLPEPGLSGPGFNLQFFTEKTDNASQHKEPEEIPSCHIMPPTGPRLEYRRTCIFRRKCCSAS